MPSFEALKPILLVATVIVLFAAGFFLGDSYASRSATIAEQAAITKAQEKIVKTVITSEKLNHAIGEEDAKKINSIVSKWRADSLSLQQTSSNSVPSIPSSTRGTVKPSCNTRELKKELLDWKTSAQLNQIQINEWQKWQREQAQTYNK